MAKIHVLTGSPTGSGVYQCVVHAATPAGNNLAGIAWSIALQNAGLATTVLPVGNGPGQITQAEQNSIANGSLFEAQFQIQPDPGASPAALLADLDVRADQASAAAIAALQNQLRYFGFTRG